MREQGRRVGANTEVSRLTETGYKLMFKPFKSDFTDRPTISRVEEYFYISFHLVHVSNFDFFFQNRGGRGNCVACISPPCRRT
jgi:hypothetical protein